MQAAISPARAKDSSPLRLRVADPHLDGAEMVVGADAPPELGRLDDRPGPLQHPDELGVTVPVPERGRDAAAREGAGEDLGANRVQAAVAAVEKGRVGRDGEQQRQQLPHPIADGDRAVGAAHPHVDVGAPGVVALGDPAKFVPQPCVVRGVDDPLVEVVGPGVGAHGAQRQPHAPDQLEEPARGACAGSPPPRRSWSRAPSGSRPRRRSARRPPTPPAPHRPGRRRRRPRSGAPAPASPDRGSRTPPRAPP